MKKITYILLIVFLYGCAQEKQALMGKTKFQQELNADFKDATKSPLTKKDLRNFKGLDFFKFDSTYVVLANLNRTPDTEFFKMKTTTSRVSNYRIYGELTFQLKGEAYRLNVYQSQELMQEDGYEDYLFLPFLDDSNGEKSYAGGRYIELRIPQADTIDIDFNTAYNPYCAYNDKYSCPIVPRANYVSTAIEAGVKAFKKH